MVILVLVLSFHGQDSDCVLQVNQGFLFPIFSNYKKIGLVSCVKSHFNSIFKKFDT